jgi:hypothetical protein
MTRIGFVIAALGLTAALAGAKGEPRVEWREPDAEPASVSNGGTSALHALRIELKFLAR